MAIFLSSSLHFHSTAFIQGDLLKSLTKQEVLIAFIALTIFGSLGYCFAHFYCKKQRMLKTNNREKELTDQEIEKDATKIWIYEENTISKSSEPNSIIRHKVSLPNGSIYNLYSDDLKDKKWKEEGEASYYREMAIIKALRKKLRIFQGQYDKLLRQYPHYHQLIRKSLTVSCVPHPYRESYQEQFQRVIYEALKVREFYKKNHYVFLHGRALSWKTFSYFTKKLIQIFRPKLKLNGIDFLRAPFDKHAFQNAYELLNHCPSEAINDHHPSLRMQLIAVDALWLNRFPAESALHFFGGNVSASLPHHETYRPLLDCCFHAHIPNREFLIQSIIEKIQNICFTLQDELWQAQGIMPGELSVICIPKAMIKDPTLSPIYRSQARGIPASTPKESIENIALLEQFQQDKIIPEMDMTQVQYRLLASHLTPKNGVRIFGINSLSKELKKIYKEPIQKLVKEIFAIVTQREIQV